MDKYAVPRNTTDVRLDQWLTQSVPGRSRARWQSLIRQGRIAVDGEVRKPGHLLRGGEMITAEIPDADPIELTGEDIPLDILFEDSDMIAINKPPGLVVHPAPGHATGTLVHGLLHHCEDLAGVGGELRPGIVHRLDKDTSGVLVAAKSEAGMLGLAAQFKGRLVRKEYLAIVCGIPAPMHGTVETLIGRSTTNRRRMAVNSVHGKQAVSHYRVERVLSGAALVRVRIETGRTHQIRVHMAHIGCPVYGDTLYGSRKRSAVPPAPRQMLHAESLGIDHPIAGTAMMLKAPLAGDMEELLLCLGPARSPGGN